MVCYDKYFFAGFVNDYIEDYSEFLKNNNIPEVYELTPNEVLSALYYFNDFDEEEMDTLLSLVRVEDGYTLEEEVKLGLNGFGTKTDFSDFFQKKCDDRYYTALVVKEKNYDGCMEVDYDQLREGVNQAFLISKFGRKYEYYDEALEDLIEKNWDISASYFSLLWDMGLWRATQNTKYEEMLRAKAYLNQVYKEFYTTRTDYQYEGGSLIKNKPKKKVKIITTEDVK